MNRKKLILLFVSIILFAVGHAQSKTVFVKECANGEDATPFVVDAIKTCRVTKATKLVFVKSTYYFQPDFATEKYVFTSNNDEGLKRIVFNLSGITDLEIDAQGSDFIFDGFVCPFLLDGSKRISLKNFSINYKRTFHSEGKIIDAYSDSLDIAFTPDFPYSISNNKLTFTGDKVIGKDNAGEPKKVIYPYWHLLEFDSAKREPAQSARDYLNVQNMIVKELKPGVVRIFLPGIVGNVGNTMVFNASDRMVPAIAILNSENIEIKNITLYHAGGMGVVAQQSKNILLDKVNVVAPPGRMISLVADATHFVNCGGKITMQNCVFESQVDDATNVHGIYVKIVRVISLTEVLVKLVHYQQFGFNFLQPNSKVEIVEAESLNTYGENSVKESEQLNKEYTKVTFKKPLLDKVKLGDVIASVDQYPDVLITNCKIQKNRARGFLLGSRGKIVIENNYFHTQCAAIVLEGDGRFWFEQAGVRDLTISNNTFDNCNYSFMLGVGVIMVGSGIEESKRSVSRYNRNIIIEKNTFRLFNPNIVRMYSVDNLTIRNNKIEKTTDYQLSDWFKKMDLQPYMISNSSNIKIGSE